MVRVLRYPYLTGLTCLCAVSCAAARDLCVGAGLLGWARVLLICTFVLLGLCFSLLSCRFFVDELGVGVGFLLRVRRTAWHELASVGVLSCNSRRTYLYGLYTHSTGFLELLHRAPGCGSWGFVVPTSRRLVSAVLDLGPVIAAMRTGIRDGAMGGTAAQDAHFGQNSTHHRNPP